MVTLLCFCCGHGNPAGAKFCNACGTPMHLKPCRRCEAINARAAAHCHQCGETFALEFLALDQAARVEDVPEASAGMADVEAPADAAGPRLLRQQRVLAARIAAVLLGLAATALLSAYYAYQHPGASAGQAQIEAALPAAGGPAAAAEVGPASALSQDPAGTDRVRPASLSEPRDIVIDTAVTGADATRSARPAPPQRTAPAVRPRAAQKRGAPASTARFGSAAAPRAGSATASRAWDASGAVAGGYPVDAGRIVGEPVASRAAVAPPSEVPVAGPAPPATRPQVGAPAPAPAMPAWGPPCAEGVALEPGCDVRTMAKGN